jgi:hypothetical protein
MSGPVLAACVLLAIAGGVIIVTMPYALGRRRSKHWLLGRARRP